MMKFRIALILIIIAALTRLLPHPPNFTPIGAIGLFGAAYFERRWLALVVPFSALFLSDLLLNNVIYSNFYPGFTWITSWWVYAAFALVMAIGWIILRQKASPQRIISASLTASVLFFLVSNAGVWAESVMYPKNIAGLMACYAAGLPFLGNTVMGDLVFSAVLFGGFAWVTRYVPVKIKA